MHKLKPAQMVVMSFFITIFAGGLLLCLPQSSGSSVPVRPLDAFFTATSAVCVTGLAALDIGKEFSKMGQLIILFLIQVGGLGIMSLSAFFAILVGKRFTLRENFVMKDAFDRYNVAELKALIVYILFFTFGIELAGAICLYFRFDNVYSAVFHSVSAFCNAGFSTYSNNLENYRQDLFVNFVIAGLIILGGLGFAVLMEFSGLCRGWFKRAIFKKEAAKGCLIKVSLQMKIVLLVTFILIVLGTIGIFLLEYDKTLYGMNFKDKLLISFFQSVTARTAGFNTVPIGTLATPTLFFVIILMFIGASPGGTGGGIKTTTMGLLIAGARSLIKGKEDIFIFKKTIPKFIFRKAVMITSLAVAWLVVFTMLLSIVEGNKDTMPNYFLRVMFEIASALGTVGLSTGITPILSGFGKILVMLTMFFGRVGPLTLAIAVAFKEDKVFLKYPEERVMVG